MILNSTARIGGLDAWRAGLVLGGLLFHALPKGTDGVLFSLVNYLSSHFRMGAFLAISGFLSAMVAEGRDADSWTRRRLQRLLPPMITGALLTVTSMMLLLHPFVSSTGEAARLALNWYHIWFLAALITYVPVAVSVLFNAPGQWLRSHLLAVSALTGSVQSALLLAVSIAAFAGLTVGAMIVPSGPATETLLNYLPLALCYLPVFVAGLLLGRFPELREPCLRKAGLPAAIIAALIGLELLSIQFFPPSWATGALVIDRLTHAVLPVPGMLLILRSALMIQAVPRWANAICDASLTIYIVHLPLIIIFFKITDAVTLHPYVRYFYVVLSAACYSWAFHLFIVSRSPVLSWMFNGTRLPSELRRTAGRP